MTGYYEVNYTTTAPGNYMSNNYTVCEVGSFGANGTLNSIALRFYTTGTFNGKVVIYNSAGTLLGSSEVQSLTVSSNSVYYDIPFTSPVAITSGTQYKVGYWTGTGAMPGMLTSNSSSAAIASTPTGMTWTPVNNTVMANSGQVWPTTTWAYRNTMKAYLDPPLVTPTSVSVTNSPVSNGTIPTISWTYSGVGATRYQFRWRKTGATDWIYDVEKTSSSTTNLPLYTTYTETFESGNGTWQSNPAFGTYTAASAVGTTTTKADTGSYSMLVTCPTSSGTAYTWANQIITLYPDMIYQISARVWIPTGVPPAALDNVFFDTSTFRSQTNNAWETIKATFKGASSGTNFVGVKLTGATTSGQIYYIDNVIISHVELSGGNYDLQIRVGNSSSWGDWSSTVNFVVNTNPTTTSVDLNPKSIGGNVNVTWTYNDVNGNTQTKYQIRRRPS